MVSDIHVGTMVGIDFLKKVINRIEEINPDMVLFVGDIINEDIEQTLLDKVVSVLKRLNPPLGKYAVPGNHEYISKRIGMVIDYLRKGGVNVLLDEWILVNSSIYIIGRKDRDVSRFLGEKRKSLSEILKGVEKEKPVIVLDHQPIDLNEASENGIDLQLSGHTHHGQLWPFNLLTKRVYEKSWGYLRKGNTQYYVSCGVGTWGPPVRLGSKSEIVHLRITFNKNEPT